MHVRIYSYIARYLLFVYFLVDIARSIFPIYHQRLCDLMYEQHDDKMFAAVTRHYSYVPSQNVSYVHITTVKTTVLNS